MYGFIVEGIKDEERIRGVLTELYGEFLIGILKGTRFSKREISMTKLMLNSCEKVFVLSDPDEAGDWIANKLLTKFPELERINVDPDEANCFRWKGWKYGVEYCSDEYLRKILVK